MKIFVKVKTGGRENKVEELDATHFAVSVKPRPEKRRANEAVIAAVAAHFGIAKSKVQILSGHSAKTKLISLP